MSEKTPVLSDAQRRLEAARLLFEGGFHSDCVSRAYYAMHQAAAWLLSKHDKEAKTHSGTVYLVRGLDPELGATLASSQQVRERCDYDAYQPSPSEAEAMVARTTDFLLDVGGGLRTLRIALR